MLGASWGANNTIAYGTGNQGIMRISANGGTPQSLIKPKSGYVGIPQILPDGKSILYTAAASNLAQGSIMVQSLQSGEPKELFAGSGARYLPTGHIIYGVGDNLFAVPFDTDTLETAGGQVPIVEGVLRTGFAPQYAVSDSGTLVYVPGRSVVASVEKRTLVWVDRNGKEEPITAAPAAYLFPRISPDGTRIALTIGGRPNSNIWIWDLVRKIPTRLTLDETIDVFPLWTPDGKRIVFSTIAQARNSVSWKAADGTGKDEPLVSLKDGTLYPSSWSRDGKTLVLTESTGTTATTILSYLATVLTSPLSPLRANTGTQADISLLSMEGDHARKPLLQGKFAEVDPQISPDGRWIAYVSVESGQFEIYVRPFPQVDGGRCTISTGGGDQPRWSPNGRELFYRSGDAMMAVPISTEPTFKPGTPTKLFQGSYCSFMGHMWDPSPDGKRFLMIKPEPTGGETSTPETRQRINIVLNWFEELKQRVPAK